MATDSDGKLTKFESAVTVVTADLANSLFGGLYGTSEASSLDSYHPLAHGHVHDGEHVDGHASRVSLSDPFHVRGVLVHANLGDDAVMKNNVYDSVYQDEVIPEYEEVDGVIYYYLDLRIIRSDFTFHEIEDPSLERGLAPGLETKLIRQREDDDGLSFEDSGYDFVFGSNSLEDLASAGTSGDNRFLYDRDKGAFRAGSVSSDQWDEANRGDYSVAFGANTTASGNSSTVSGGQSNEASALNSVVSGGQSNEASAANTTVGGGYDNTSNALRATVGGGYENTASGEIAVVSGGNNNEASGASSTVSGGSQGEASGGWSTVSGGASNVASADYTTIGGGLTNTVDDQYSVISGGLSNEAKEGSDYSTVSGGSVNKVLDGSQASTISGGLGNEIGTTVVAPAITASCEYSVIGGGNLNKVYDGSGWSFVGGGAANEIGEQNTGVSFPCTASTITGGGSNKIIESSEYSFVGGGQSNSVENTSPYSVIGGGFQAKVQSQYSSILGGSGIDIYQSSDYSTVCGGKDNNIATSPYSFVGGGGGAGGGDANQITDSTTSAIVGGIGNIIDGTSGLSFIGAGERSSINAATNSGIASGKLNSIVDSWASFIGGGEENFVGSGGSGSPGGFVGGGKLNKILAVSPYTAIVCGDRNEITGDGFGANFIGSGEFCIMNEVDYSSIVCGQGNQVSDGSDHSFIGSGKTNVISQAAKGSAILGGTLNSVSSVEYSSILGGEGSKIKGGMDATSGYHSTASGYYSYSYLRGQTSQASHAFHIEGNAILLDYNIGGGPGIWALDLLPAEYPTGSSQTFVLTFSGHWDYPDINAVFPPASPQKFGAYLDGATLGHFGFRGEKLVPRPNSSYSYSLDCILRFSEVNGGAGSIPHCIAFKMSGGIITYPDGRFAYSSNEIPMAVSFNSSVATISNPNTPTAGTDFEIFFTHSITAPANDGSWGDLDGWIAANPGELPGLFAVVINNDPANWVGECIVARVEVVENALHLAMHPAGPP